MWKLLLILFSIAFFSCNNNKIEMTTSEKLPDGRIVKTFHLQNKNGIKVNVTEYGATILNIFTPDNKNHFADIVPGYDSVSSYLNDHSYFGCIVGRFANRIADGEFKLDSVTYQLAKNENGINHLHGGNEGLNKKLWSGEYFTNENTTGVKLTYTSPDGEEGYPGNLKIEVTYSLHDSDELHINYSATTDKSTVVNLTNHSYFNLSGNCDSSILNHQLEINADSFLPVNNKLIPTGAPAKVENTPFDFRTAKTIGKDIAVPDSQFIFCNGGYDHCFVLNKSGDTPSFALRLTEPTSGRILEIYTDQPGIQFYSGNFFNGSVTGKKGCSYKKYGALVFEPQKFPDSPNQPSYPSTVLKQGEKYTQHTILKFKTVP